MRTLSGPLVGAVLFVAAIGGIFAVHAQPAKPAYRPFTLVSAATGREVTDQTFRGKWLLVFFGYTYCPDVCPTTLNNIAETMSDLGLLAQKVQPLFVTVDPARDTPDVLTAYTAAFDPRILGLSGSPEQISRAADEFGARFFGRDVDGGYFVDHTATVYVIGPDGLLASSFLPTDDPSNMAEDLKRRMASSDNA